MKLPLTALHYFDAAAREGSFARAADQLHVTHGAVSRQVRQLEDALGLPLFERRNRAVHLNEAGRTLYAVTASVFEQLDEVRHRLSRPRSDRLVVSCEPTLAMKWLIPRLPAFHRQHPDINLHLMAAGGPIDLGRSGVDLALRRNDFPWSSALHTDKICDEWMGPVWRPPLPEGHQLHRTTLLHPASRPQAWSAWSRQSRISIRGADRIDYEHFYLCIQAATAGLGTAIASFLMVQDELTAGQLQAPHGFIRDGSSYYLLSRHPLDGDDATRCFHHWLSTEIARCLPG